MTIEEQLEKYIAENANGRTRRDVDAELNNIADKMVATINYFDSIIRAHKRIIEIKIDEKESDMGELKDAYSKAKSLLCAFDALEMCKHKENLEVGLWEIKRDIENTVKKLLEWRDASLPGLQAPESVPVAVVQVPSPEVIPVPAWTILAPIPVPTWLPGGLGHHDG